MRIARWKIDVYLWIKLWIIKRPDITKVVKPVGNQQLNDHMKASGLSI